MYTQYAAYVLRSDGAVIPLDAENADYAAYLEWVAAGNTPQPAPAPAAAQIIASYEAALQAELDAGAQGWGYDSIISAASYATSTNAQFKAEAAALIGWRDAAWIWAAAQLAAVQAGTQAMPATPAAFVAAAPAQPARPSAS